MSMFKECVESLGKNVQVLSKNEDGEIIEKLEKYFLLNSSGWVDWKKYTIKSNTFYQEKDITITLETLLKKVINYSIYITGDNADNPTIKTKLDLAIDKFEYIESIAAGRLFLFNFNQGYIIEIKSNGAITIGISPNLL